MEKAASTHGLCTHLGQPAWRHPGHDEVLKLFLVRRVGAFFVNRRRRHGVQRVRQRLGL